MNLVPTVNVRGEDLVKKWLLNQRKFLIPLLTLYVSLLIAKVQQEGFSIMTFVPTNVEITALFLYVLNAAYDYLLKLQDSI